MGSFNPTGALWEKWKAQLLLFFVPLFGPLLSILPICDAEMSLQQIPNKGVWNLEFAIKKVLPKVGESPSYIQSLPDMNAPPGGGTSSRSSNPDPTTIIDSSD